MDSLFVSDRKVRLRMRLDKYLKVSRLIKRRPVANEACNAGRIMVNGKVAKASVNVKPGDILEIAFGDKTMKVEVVSLEETYKKMRQKNCTRFCRVDSKRKTFFIYLLSSDEGGLFYGRKRNKRSS